MKWIASAAFGMEGMTGRDLKHMGNYKKGGNKGFDTVITRLQMQTFVLVNDFKYNTDRYGREYGWGVAEYATPEWLFGEEEFRAATYGREPEESFERIFAHLRGLFPGADEAALRKVIG